MAKQLLGKEVNEALVANEKVIDQWISGPSGLKSCWSGIDD